MKKPKPEILTGDTTAAEDIAGTRRIVGEDVEVVGGGPEYSHFTGVPKQSRQQRKAEAADSGRMVLNRIVLYFENGHVAEMDISKVDVIDRVSKQSLLDFVIEGES